MSWRSPILMLHEGGYPHKVPGGRNKTMGIALVVVLMGLAALLGTALLLRWLHRWTEADPDISIGVDKLPAGKDAALERERR